MHAHPLRAVVLTAPSGAGKTTIARRAQAAIPDLSFSVSATTRPPRPGERDGVDYYFMTEAEFGRRVAAGEFLEYEEVYPGVLYGTLRSEIYRDNSGTIALLDIDVKGASHLKELLGEEILTIFIQPPSLEILGRRLAGRGSESADSLAARLKRAEMEMNMSDRFDKVVVNDDLDKAVKQVVNLIRNR